MEKQIDVAGFQLKVAISDERAEGISRNPLYRRIVKPSLRLVSGRSGRPQAAPEVPQPATPAATGRDQEGDRIWEEVSKIRWYHTIDLGHGVITPGFIDNRDTVDLFGLPEDMTGMRCLDIGTYDGFWAFEMERRGASEVVGIDVDSPLDYDLPRRDKQRLIAESGTAGEMNASFNRRIAGVGLQMPGDGFRLAAELLGSKARREVLDVYDLSPEKLGTFDVVLISQLLLRLRDPQTAIENMFSVCRGVAIIGEPYDDALEKMSRPVSEFVGTERVGAWWVHSIKSMAKMMKVAGFEPVEEVTRLLIHNKVGSFLKVILKGHVPPK